MIQTSSKPMLHIALLGTLILGSFSSSDSFAGLYKWVDEKGKIHYGDRPPPVNTEYGHEVLSKSGMKVRTVERELTSEERIAASHVSKEMQQKAREAQELKRIDRLLSASFPNFQTLNTARDDRLTTLDDSIAYLQIRKDALQVKRGDNDTRIQHFVHKNLAVPDQLSTEASTLDRAAAQLDAQIADIHTDREATVSEFGRYATRLEQLLKQR